MSLSLVVVQQGYYIIPGATTVGIKGVDSVVLASEKRLSYGNFVVSKNAQKVFQLTRNAGAACAGLVSDMQGLIREAKALINLYILEQGRLPSVNTVAKVLSTYLFGNRLFPYFTETVVGGVDSTGPHIYVLDPLGSVIEDDYTAVGSGAEIAAGVLETWFKPGARADEISDLAVKAVKAGATRDAASGNGIDILVIGRSGVIRMETIQL
ncbi:Proteasome subunit beta 2 [Candidatus Calditenuaceae archaeon HR02]|nr:Proteasome subunit beta 2 [Candidatus Calditenuaceae archaeon HR02]